MKLFGLQSKYDYKKIFHDVTIGLKTLEGLDDSIKDLLGKILSNVEAPFGSVFVHIPEKNILGVKYIVGQEPLIVALTTDHEFIRYIKGVHPVLFKDEILNKNDYSIIRSAGIHFFTQTNSHAIVNLKVQDEWIGVLAIGKPKKPFTEEDRQFLEVMGYWLAYHIANCSLYSRVRNQNIKLNEMTEVKNQLMANVTHELRTPLNGILGLTEVVLDGSDGPINDDQRLHLEMVRSSAESILSIVNNILSLIKVEAQKREISIGKVGLKTLVDEVAMLYESIILKKNNRFESSIGVDQIIYGNEDQIRTLFMNLIGNATKFTENGEIEVSTQKSGEMLKVIIKDTGAGIRDANLSKVFDEFTQGDGSMTREHGGTGLGLAVAKKIVEIHGGRIGVESRVGVGSEFYFTLPLRPDRFNLLPSQV